MAPHEGRRPKNLAKQQLEVAPLGADGLPPSEPSHADPAPTRSRVSAWMTLSLLILACSYAIMLPGYGQGWAEHITTQVSLTASSGGQPTPIIPTEQAELETAPSVITQLSQQPSHPQPEPESDLGKEVEETRVDAAAAASAPSPPAEETQPVEPWAAGEGEPESSAAAESHEAAAAAVKAKSESPPPAEVAVEGESGDTGSDGAVGQSNGADVTAEAEKKDGEVGEEKAPAPKEPQESDDKKRTEEEAAKLAAEEEGKKPFREALEYARNTPRAPPVNLSHIALDADADDPTSEPEPRVAVCFNGQLKNVQPMHVANFTSQVLGPLLEYFAHVDVYLHSFNAVEFHNPRNMEIHWPINVTASIENIVEGLRAFEPGKGKVKIKGIVVTDPQDADATFKPLDYYLAHGDPYKNEGLSLFNSLRSYYSLEAVTKLWENKRSRRTLADGTEQEEEYYHTVVYARSDLIYYTRLPLIPQTYNGSHFSFVTKPDDAPWTVDELVPNNTLFTAPFDESYGLNDRFGYGRPPVMRLYGNRGRSIDDFFAAYPDQSLWAEPFLHKVVIDMNGVKKGRIEQFMFARVRATGYYAGSRRLGAIEDGL